MTRFHLLYMVVLYERVTNNKLLCLFVCLYKSVSYGFSLQFMQRHLHMFAYTDRRTDRRRRRQIYSHWILCISTSWHSGLHLDSLIFFCCFFFSLLHFAVTYKRFRNVFFFLLLSCICCCCSVQFIQRQPLWMDVRVKARKSSRTMLCSAVARPFWCVCMRFMCVCARALGLLNYPLG